MFIKYNKTPSKDRKIKFIVIHDSGNRKQGAGVDNHFRYFNGANRESSADFFVDDKMIGQFTDYKNEYAWHCGRFYGTPLVPQCKNSNSIGIEICINSDSNYKKTIENTIELVKYLQEELNIPNQNVIRHYDASLKRCPGSMLKGNWQEWNIFKQKLEGVNKSENIHLKVKLKQKYKFSDTTVEYIGSYKHSSDLMNAFIEQRPISKPTKEFILNYKFGKEILNKVYNE